MEIGAVTRRSALLYAAAVFKSLAQTAPLLSNLRLEHPRLLWLPDDVQRTRDLLRDNATARKCMSDLEHEAERVQNTQPQDYKLNGGSMLSQSRRVLDRIYTLGVMYRLDGKPARLERAVRELRAAASFRDWNPQHFLDTAEMTHAVAIGYDWLYPALSDADRRLLRSAIINKGLQPGLEAYQNPASWAGNHYNWNLVCNGGLVTGALAVAEDAPEIANSILKFALESIPKAMASYGTDGGWIEGPGYWEYGTHYSVVMLAALESALGRTFGLDEQPGFSRAGRFRIYFTSPTNRVFNYADATEDPADEPAMFWLAKRFNQPAFSWQQTKFAERARTADPLNLVWLQREVKAPQLPQWPLDAIFPSVQCAFFRSSWEDSSGLFLAVKGGDNKAPHSHLDLGSFVFDAGGVRWAADLGPDDYSLPGYFGKQRWQYFRIGTESHNTPMIDGQNQDLKAEARITRHEFGPEASWVQLDLTRAYSGRVINMQRKIGMLKRLAVLVEDIVQTGQPADVLWSMMTSAEINVTGNTAILTKGSWSLSAEIQAPRHAVFDVFPAKAPPPQAQNESYNRLVVKLGEQVKDLQLTVLLTPYRTGQPKPKVSGGFPA